MVNWSIVSQTHLLYFVRVIPEHIAVISYESSIVIELLVHDLLLFILWFGHIKNWFDTWNSHRLSSKILRVRLVSLMKYDAVRIWQWRLDLFLQLGDWIAIELIFRNTRFGSNDLTIDIEWFHIVTEINLRVLHFSQLTLRLISVSRRVSLVYGYGWVRSPNRFVLTFNKFYCCRLHISWLWLCVRFWHRCIFILFIFYKIMTLSNVFRCSGNWIKFASLFWLLSCDFTWHINLSWLSSRTGCGPLKKLSIPVVKVSVKATGLESTIIAIHALSCHSLLSLFLLWFFVTEFVFERIVRILVFILWLNQCLLRWPRIVLETLAFWGFNL